MKRALMPIGLLIALILLTGCGMMMPGLPGGGPPRRQSNSGGPGPGPGGAATPTIVRLLPTATPAAPSATPALSPTASPVPSATPGSAQPPIGSAQPPIGTATPVAPSPTPVAQPATPAAAGQPASASAAQAADASLSGEWDFTFGKLSLTQRDMDVVGTYQWYGGADAGKVTGVVVPVGGYTLGDLDQFQGMWISDRNPSSQNLLRWQLAAAYSSFSGATQDGSTKQQWCGVRSGQPLPAGCGFSGVWELHFASQPGVTGQASLVQTGGTVQGTYVDGKGHSGEIVDGVVSVQSLTEVRLTGTWRNDQGEQDTFEWRLDLTTGRTFQGRRNPGNSEWCGWRAGASQPQSCGGTFQAQ
jgi:hypothetical protein